MMNGKAPNIGRPRNLRGGAGVAAVIAVLAGIYLFWGSNGNEQLTPVQIPDLVSELPPAVEPKTVTKALATGNLAAFVVKPERKPVAELFFLDGAGKTRSIKEWRDRVVLVNLWATWCAPCRKEMPELAGLERRYGSKDFEVVAISLDRESAKAATFLEETQARGLKLYVDPTSKSIELLSALGLPATVLIDRQGREIGRLLGPADWTSPEALRLISVALNEANPGS
jgi:thiol-disulfide isomerase/thioredoxin